MRSYCLRLRRGADLLESIDAFVREKRIDAAVVLSAVGCVSRARLRDADGSSVREIVEDMEILCVHGTASMARSHLHIALSRQGLGAIGGHLLSGTIVNTTCELVLLALPDWRFLSVEDPQTGYEEIRMIENEPKRRNL